MGVKLEGCPLVCGRGPWVLYSSVPSSASSLRGWTRDGDDEAWLRKWMLWSGCFRLVSGSLKPCLLLVLPFLPASLVNCDWAKAMALDAESRRSSVTAWRMQPASAKLPGLLVIILIKWKLINGSVNKEAAGKLTASQLPCARHFWVCWGDRLWHDSPHPWWLGEGQLHRPHLSGSGMACRQAGEQRGCCGGSVGEKAVKKIH